MRTNLYYHKTLKKEERWYTQARSFRNLHYTDFCQENMKKKASLRGNKCKGEASLGNKWAGPQINSYFGVTAQTLDEKLQPQKRLWKI